jgi:hypothetical protein
MSMKRMGFRIVQRSLISRDWRYEEGRSFGKHIKRRCGIFGISAKALGVSYFYVQYWAKKVHGKA